MEINPNKTIQLIEDNLVSATALAELSLQPGTSEQEKARFNFMQAMTKITAENGALNELKQEFQEK